MELKHTTGVISTLVIAAAIITVYHLSNSQEVEAQNDVHSSKSMSSLISKVDSLNKTIEKLAPLNSRIIEVQGSISSLTSRLEKIEGDNTDDTDTNSYDKVEVVNLPESYDEQDMEISNQTFLSALDTDFMSQSVDEAWSTQAEISISEAFQNSENPLYQSTQLTSVHCRSNACKLEVHYEQGSDAEEFEADFFIDAMKRGFPKARGMSDEGSSTGLYYLTASSSQNIDSASTAGVTPAE